MEQVTADSAHASSISSSHEHGAAATLAQVVQAERALDALLHALEIEAIYNALKALGQWIWIHGRC